jgi:hypothetical protein
MATKIDSVTARDKLKIRREPYWHRISKGCFLGYRKMMTGPGGSWVARSLDESTGKQNYSALGDFSDIPDHLRFDVAQKTAVVWFDHRKAAYGDIDPVEMWEAAVKEVVILQKELVAAQADDQKAEIIKWRRIADAANRRQDELMDTVNQREKELRRMANWLRRIGAALCEPDNSKLPALVEALARTAKAKAQTPDKPVSLAEPFHRDPESQWSSTFGTCSKLAAITSEVDVGEVY